MQHWLLNWTSILLTIILLAFLRVLLRYKGLFLLAILAMLLLCRIIWIVMCQDLMYYLLDLLYSLEIHNVDSLTPMPPPFNSNNRLLTTFPWLLELPSEDSLWSASLHLSSINARKGHPQLFKNKLYNKSSNQNKTGPASCSLISMALRNNTTHMTEL